MGNRKKKKLVRESDKESEKHDITNNKSESETITKSAEEMLPSQPRRHSTIKKAVAVIFLVCAVSAMIALALGKITPLNFWLTTIFCAAFAWIVLPRIK